MTKQREREIQRGEMAQQVAVLPCKQDHMTTCGQSLESDGRELAPKTCPLMHCGMCVTEDNKYIFFKKLIFNLTTPRT